MKVLLLLLAGWGWVWGVEYSVYYNISYGEDTLQKLDLYVPDVTGEPIILVVHGGAWHTGDKSNVSHIAEYLAERGYLVVNINYRLAPYDTFPDQPNDVARALRWAKAVGGGVCGADSGRVCLLGSSAGAHLAALVGLSPEVGWCDSLDTLCSCVSIRVSAVVGLSGVYDFDLVPDLDTVTLLEFIGDTTNWNDAEPINYVDSTDTVHFLLVHGMRDSLVGWWQSDSLHARILEAGGFSELVHFETFDHGDPVIYFVDSVGPIVVEFLNELFNYNLVEDVEINRASGSFLFTSSVWQVTGLRGSEVVEIFDFQGRLLRILKKLKNENSLKIEVDGFKPGIYMLETDDGKSIRILYLN